jgi:hypothetical protein
MKFVIFVIYYLIASTSFPSILMLLIFLLTIVINNRYCGYGRIDFCYTRVAARQLQLEVLRSLEELVINNGDRNLLRGFSRFKDDLCFWNVNVVFGGYSCTWNCYNSVAIK